MDLIKTITINGLPLSYHRVALLEIDLDTASVRTTVRSWFSRETAEQGLPPHWVHQLYSVGDPMELGTVVQRALQNSDLADAVIVPYEEQATIPEA